MGVCVSGSVSVWACVVRCVGCAGVGVRVYGGRGVCGVAADVGVGVGIYLFFIFYLSFFFWGKINMFLSFSQKFKKVPEVQKVRFTHVRGAQFLVLSFHKN